MGKDTERRGFLARAWICIEWEYYYTSHTTAHYTCFNAAFQSKQRGLPILRQPQSFNSTSVTQTQTKLGQNIPIQSVRMYYFSINMHELVRSSSYPTCRRGKKGTFLSIILLVYPHSKTTHYYYSDYITWKMSDERINGSLNDSEIILFLQLLFFISFLWAAFIPGSPNSIASSFSAPSHSPTILSIYYYCTKLPSWVS